MTGAARLSSARAVKCPVQSVNERNPYLVLYFSQGTALVNREEGGDDVKSAWLLRLGRHTRYNGE
jgi:hypothetical protein